MEETNRKVVSDIVGSLNSLGIDDRLSNRLILSKVKDRMTILIKQDTDSRRLFAVSATWKKIDCLDLKPVPAIECGCDVVGCDIVMKSVDRLPLTYLSSYGNIIKVFTINNQTEYKQTTVAGYREILRREISDPKVKYFWIDNGYVFVPNSSVVSVVVRGLFINPHEADRLNPGADECLSPLDALFPAPEYLLSIAKGQVIEEIAGIYRRLPPDERPDLNSNNKV